MAEPKVIIPRVLGWSVLASVAGFIWFASRQNERLDQVVESNSQMIKRVEAVERDFSTLKADSRWIVRALERSELRSGYVPPPAPSAASATPGRE